MKKFIIPIFFLVTLLSCTIASAQITDKMDPGPYPMDVSTRLISYVGVVQVPGVSAIDMLHHGLNWFNTFYKNPTNVIRETDSLRNKIIGKARFKIYNPADKKGLKTDAGNVEYTITLNLKDNKYRYIVTDINWKQTSYYPVERWLDTTAQSYSKVYPFYLEQMDAKIHEVLKNLETFMQATQR